MLECVVNVSEGRRPEVVELLARAAGRSLLDVHSDPVQNRSVLTLAGPEVEEATRRVAAVAVAHIDIRTHQGAHPRLGAIDVVPFVPLGGTALSAALRARDAFARWAAGELGVPCFLYGPERSLPEIRRAAFVSLAPDFGPLIPHPTAGATCVGARGVLVAYNVWLPPGTPLTTARRIAGEVRNAHVRALGLPAADGMVMVSMNLIDPERVGPAQAYDAVAARTAVERAELVGLVPESVLRATPRERWAQLDLDASKTIEARLRQAGLDGGGEPT
jgi:glutamate formiminotransferase